MMAICEQCQAAFPVRHTRGVKLHDRCCPFGHFPLLYATFNGFDADNRPLYQARSKPELILPVFHRIHLGGQPAQLPEPLIARGAA